MIKKLDSMLGEMREFAREQHIPISSSESIETIEQFLFQQQPKHCLEIGTCIGYGTIEIARRIAQRGGQITSYEISIPSFALAQAYIKESGLSNITLKFENILIQEDKSFDKLRMSKEQSFTVGLLATNNISESIYDFIYIDGQKSKYLDFLFLVIPHASKNATIIFDDVLAFPEKTKPLRDRITSNNIAHHLIQHHDGDGMLILQLPFQQF